MGKDNHTFRAPENPEGFEIYHNKSGNPIPKKTLMSLYDNILGPVHEETVRNLKREFSLE